MEYFGTPKYVGELTEILVDGIPFHFEVVKEQDEEYTEHTLIFYHELSNGQVLSLAFSEVDFLTLNASVVIANTHGYARLWHFIAEPNDEVTGKCGLEGLRKAFKLLKWFTQNILPDSHSIEIYSEGKKAKAYKYLKRIGFDEKFSTNEVSIFEFAKDGEITYLQTLTDIKRILTRIHAYGGNF